MSNLIKQAPVLNWDSDADIKTYAKVGLAGSSGGGKTRTAIEMAKALVSDESKIAVINTEGASGAKVYKRLYPGIKIVTLDDYSPKNFIQALKMTQSAQMEAVIIDSGTHEWEGVLAMVNASTVPNDLAKWKVPDALHKEFLGLVKSIPMHTFMTIRTKTKHAMQKGADGKVGIVKKPGALMQRAGVDYEFDLVLVMSDAGTATVDKSHYDTIPVGMSFVREPEKIAAFIKEFLYPNEK